MTAHKKSPSAHGALTRRIIVLALALWLAAMSLLTWAVAQDMLHQVTAETRNHVSQPSYHDRALPKEYAHLDGMMERQTIQCLGNLYHWVNIEPLLPIVRPQRPTSYSSDDWIWDKWDLLYGFEAAESYYDTDHHVLLDTGTYLAFYYTDSASWGDYHTDALGIGYIDLEMVKDGVDVFENYISDAPYGDLSLNMFLPILRLTGHFDGNRFQPIQIERGFYLDWNFVESDISSLCKADHRGKVEWTTILDLTGDAAYTDQPVTLYAWDFESILTKHDPVTTQTATFPSLTELLHAEMQVRFSEKSPAPVTYEKESLLESIIILHSRNEDAYGSYTYAVAVRCWPLTYAALRLVPTYLVSLGLLILCVWLMLRSIRKHLTSPLERLAYSTSSGTTVLPENFWKEPDTLAHYLIDSRQILADTQAELQQTKSALRYAEDAEEKRRQLISNITHELKTPLAVIHSYVEGLQSDIAEEKKAHYLTVIQDETQRMDTLVLQMLDLSRLEAGKVHLTMESFSLLRLTQTIAKRFEPMLIAKPLTLIYGNVQDFPVTADEGRIEQVISNLMTNAIKYTNEGGKICIHITLHQRKALFSIENTSAPLSADALSKVWDSFYRADASRIEPGTGLGLALVKQIIELHRGTCHAQNIQCGTGGTAENRVLFSFTLPV